jgi:hypothetical protein
MMEDRTIPTNLPVAAAAQNAPLSASQGQSPVATSRAKQLNLPMRAGEYVTNLRDDNERERILIERSMCPTDQTLDMYVGKIIAISAVLVNIGEFINEQTGELEEKLRATITLADGATIGTTGKALMGIFSYMVGHASNGEFSPPLEYEVGQHKSVPPKRPYFTLRRVLPALPGARKGGGK